MLKVENIETYGWEAAIRGMRNPMNSWDKSDSVFDIEFDVELDMCPEGRDILNRPVAIDEPTDMVIGDNDEKLMLDLCKGGPVHAKFRRMLTITMDITAPLYWWKEFDTYKVGTVANSCSTMHKIHAKKFELDDFSHEHLIRFNQDILELTINNLNQMRDMFLETKDKGYWWQMIQLLPSSYNQRRTVQLNYEVAHNIYISRKDHKLDEWHVLCDEFKNLQDSWLITEGKD